MKLLALLLFSLATPSLAEVVVRPELSPGGSGRLQGSVAIAVGETLRVELPSQPGTGYSWEPRLAAPAILVPHADVCPERAPTDLVGAVETACFAFDAVGPGETTAVFVYRRHWETRPDGVLRYDLAVTAAAR